MRGGYWDSQQAVEEIAETVKAWRSGEVKAEWALEEIEHILYRNNFAELLEGDDQEGKEEAKEVEEEV